jgi:hypothetical protein
MMAVITERAEDGWGTAAIAELVSPSTAGNARFLAFWRQYERASASPNAAATMIRPHRVRRQPPAAPSAAGDRPRADPSPGGEHRLGDEVAEVGPARADSGVEEPLRWPWRPQARRAAV